MNRDQGFTLLELLVVVSIIAILVGIIIPAYFGAREGVKTSKAKATAKNLETAFKEYLNHYRVWPSVVNDENDMEVSGDLYDILKGEKVGSDNPEEIAFFEFEIIDDASAPADTACDPWKYDPDGNIDWRAYRVRFDAGFDNKIGDIYRSVIVWSVGPDRVDGTDDDVRSWE